ncbi:MAG TPA: hypothetical protein VNL94_00225, partial [Candidatus Binatia bacterium]|nr:hypothetical protein [Candidatus Binatia bacterium]
PRPPGPAGRPGYTPAVDAQRIAESLAFINWTVLTTLAVGTFGAVVAGRLRTEATRGYLAFTAFSAAAFAVLAALSDSGLPALRWPTGAPVAAAVPALEAARPFGLWALAILAVGYAVAIWRGGRAPALAAAGLAAAAVTLVSAAATWGAGGPVAIGAALMLAQLVILSAALGGVWAAMVLGHWYLVTPRLPEAPLVRFSTWLTFVIGVQLALFVGWTALGAGPAARPAFGELTGEWALFVWLRLLVGLVFPLIVSWASIQTAKTRSMESATGLLYINVGTIAAGTILAAGLYFGAGLLV